MNQGLLGYPRGALPEVDPWEYALSDLSSALTTGTKEITRARFPGVILGIRGSLGTASTSGIVTVNVLVNGVSIVNPKLTFDVNELTTVTASVPVEISAPLLKDDDQIALAIDVIGTTAAGLKVCMYVRRI